MENEVALIHHFETMWPLLDERGRRLFAAGQSQLLGHGGVTLISQISGLSRQTITKGIKEISSLPIEDNRIRRKGAGRPSLESLTPNLIQLITGIIDETTRGDPETPLLWTLKSTRTIANELDVRYQIKLSYAKVNKILKNEGYSLQVNKKAEEGASHEDRDLQFRFIAKRVKKALTEGQPVISIDTKKKELVGNFDNKGRQYHKSKCPRIVKGHDFPDPATPRAYPYGVYDIGLNKGFVNIGTDHDTGEFAVASIRGWWYNEGIYTYPEAKYIQITADGGGSNSYRHRLWKYKLQQLATEIGLSIRVCHFPPGTSKWNKIEHRLFSFISSNWRGEPLVDYETIVNLISNTKTTKGLTVSCRLDRNKYEIGRKISDEQMKSVKLVSAKFHGEWNYKIEPV